VITPDENSNVLTEAYRKRGLVLVIGAGVSQRSGLPTWTALLGRMADALNERGGPHFAPGGTKFVNNLRRTGFSLGAIASLFRALCASGQQGDLEFTMLLRDALYRDFTPYRNRHATGDLQAEVLEAGRANTTLRAVAAMCAVQGRTDSGEQIYLRNPQIHGIVTFNADTLLREYVEARYRGRRAGHLLVRSIERASKDPDPDKISIYYMHGLLRFDLKAQNPDKEASDKLVFTEQQYFDFFNDPTSQFNYTFLYLLREHPCLFIGLSLQDDNIRRLLHYSQRERVHAYRDEQSSLGHSPKNGTQDFERKARRHFVLLKRNPSKPTLDALTTRSLSLLGVTAIWFDRFADIPAILRAVYHQGATGKTGGTASTADWNAVYPLPKPAHR
jgi:hypothetical protein